ncbi:MAG: DUF3108 domain-containing protein [Acidiferrobacterales bacterium]|nr:DUF3108 domain-containing protein [Acidiferrobacterales bacterium]
MNIRTIDRTKTKGAKQLFLAFSLVFIAIAMPAWAVEIGNQTLRYAVDYRGTDAGELEIQVSREGDQYSIKTVSHLSLVAQLFLQSYTIETAFSVENGVPALLSGKEELNQSGETVREFSVNLKTREVEYQGADNVPFDASTRVDADAFPLGMMLSDANSLIGKPYLSVSPKRARLFVVQEAVEAEVTVPAGTFKARLIKSARPDDQNRFVNIWLKPGDNPIPVKIESGKPGKVTTMTLLK